MNLTRSFRLSVNGWRLWFSETWGALADWYLRRTCPHLFRAALLKGKPARVCKMCDFGQELSREDFYAEFGERYQAMLHTEPLPNAYIGNSTVTQESAQIN